MSEQRRLLHLHLHPYFAPYKYSLSLSLSLSSHSASHFLLSSFSRFLLPCFHKRGIINTHLIHHNTEAFCRMGACASKFTVLKNASDAPPPAVKNEVECREVNPAEEVAAKKDDAAEEDEASRRQSLGHLLSEGEEKKGSAESNGTEVKPEAVADDETEKAPVLDGLKSKALEEEILACQNVATEVETVKLETKEEVEALKTEKSEVNKAVEVPETQEVQPEKEEEKPAEATKCETPETEKTEVASDAEKKETDEKSTEQKPEATEEQKPTSEAEKKNAEEKPIETSEKKPESPEIEKTEQKGAAYTKKNEVEEKPAENAKVETSDEVEDKHVLEARTTETCSVDKASEPASDAEKPKAEEEKAKS